MDTKRSTLRTIEDIFSWLALIALALLPFSETIARVFFKTGVPSSPLILSHLVLVVGLIAGMITTREKEHLSVALVQYLPNEKLKETFSIISNLIAAFTVTVFAWCSASFVAMGLTPWKIIGFIPDQIFGLIMPFGYAVMAVRFALAAPLRGKARLVSAAVVLFGTFFSLPVIAKLFWGFESPVAVAALTDQLNAFVAFASLPLCLALVASVFVGTPLFVVLGGLSLILIQSTGGELDVVANQAYTLLTQSSMAAIPLFTIVGFFLSESKAGERLVFTFKNLFGWIPGGMIIATVVVCAFFTTFTGASGVTILALGGILSTILIDKAKYPPHFTVGLLTAVGSIGLLFPPSLPIILVGATTQTNILHMFAGGIVPGVILVISMIGFGIFSAIKNKVPVEKFDLKETLVSLKSSVWELLLPIWLVVGYFSGLLSILETGAAAVVYTFVIEVFVNRDIKLREVPRVFSKALPIIGGVLSILALSQALSYYIVDTQVPEMLTDWVSSVVKSKFLFLLLLNLALIAVGCLMDIFSAILVVLPLIAPLGAAYGINPVHLGIIFVLNMEVGFLTPPIGLNLFLAAYRFKRPFIEICRSVLPFLFIQLVVVLLVTYVPWFTLALLPLFG
ncbi:MAG: TRAP transporter large permease subunit [Treponemataceae bacterium]